MHVTYYSICIHHIHFAPNDINIFIISFLRILHGIYTYYTYVVLSLLQLVRNKRTGLPNSCHGMRYRMLCRYIYMDNIMYKKPYGHFQIKTNITGPRVFLKTSTDTLLAGCILAGFQNIF